MKMIKSPETEQLTFEAILFLAILASYHKSDAAKLNPYLRQLKNSSDGDLMRQLCRASNSALQTAIRYFGLHFSFTNILIRFSAYQVISDDSTLSMSSFTLESVVSRLHPNRVLNLTSLPVATRDRFNDR